MFVNVYKNKEMNVDQKKIHKKIMKHYDLKSCKFFGNHHCEDRNIIVTMAIYFFEDATVQVIQGTHEYKINCFPSLIENIKEEKDEDDTFYYINIDDDFFNN